jgi:hypothetical protein
LGFDSTNKTLTTKMMKVMKAWNINKTSIPRISVCFLRTISGERMKPKPIPNWLANAPMVVALDLIFEYSDLLPFFTWKPNSGELWRNSQNENLGNRTNALTNQQQK